MSSQDVSTLVDMGFERNRALRALDLTGHQGVEPAMEWLLAHAEEPLPTNESGSADAMQPTERVSDKNDDKSENKGANGGSEDMADQPNVQENTTATSDQVKSLKCNECGKIFKSQLEIEYHAAKSNHSSFSESLEEKKSLTEEEKRDQLKKLEERMRAKRLEREEKEKKDALEREKMRIRSGKEMVAAKKKLEEQEMKKIVEQRKREKLEEKLARQRVKEQIEQDKIARKEKFGMSNSSELETTSLVAEPKIEQPTPTCSKIGRDYTHTKLQIRLTNGQCLAHTFGSKEQLSAVRLYVEMNRTDGDAPFLLMTNFPKKIFSLDDYDKPLDVLGLVPSAVLIVSKTSTNKSLE